MLKYIAIFMLIGSQAYAGLCDQLATLSISMAEARDRGIPQSVVEQTIRTTPDDGTTPGLKETTIAMLGAVYSLKDLPPQQVSVVIYQICVANTQ